MYETVAAEERLSWHLLYVLSVLLATCYANQGKVTHIRRYHSLR